jgi:hypothetical protein
MGILVHDEAGSNAPIVFTISVVESWSLSGRLYRSGLGGSFITPLPPDKPDKPKW